jgi:hypothetical protein
MTFPELPKVLLQWAFRTLLSADAFSLDDKPQKQIGDYNKAQLSKTPIQMV